MKSVPVLTIFLGVLLLSAVAVSAGQLDADLATTVVQSAPGSMISVWIEVKPAPEAVSLKTAVAAAATRAEAHAVACTELKQRASVQTELIGHLADLKNAGHADRVKGHWITNIVEADVTSDQLAELAKRDDIVNIYLKPTVTAIGPSVSDETDGAVLAPDASTTNLRHINADDAWYAGYNGAGRLVCSFDTGINALHPALYSRWKGLDGDSAAAWFDPREKTSFPHSFPAYQSTTPYHGTHTMGIMVGADPTTYDTVGVAPGARWISAAVIDIPGASILDAFEWAADPDGDPNTVADVPDVINHSWGFRNISCINVFYAAVDNTEALGIVNIFAAGNSGSLAATIQSPADRALDSLDCFAVGNLNSTTDVIVGSSSCGPSPCDLVSIKPNVVAPGYNIRSCWYDYTVKRYEVLGGTSMAAPHVSGLVALLRQKNPNATVDEIKTAILTSTRRAGTWGAMPNNTYGWGEIDCMAALNLLSATNSIPHIRLYDFEHDPIAAGDTVVGRVRLQNTGFPAAGVTAVVINGNEALTILDGTLSFGNINEGAIVRSSDSIRVVVADTVTDGSVLATDFVVQRGASNDTLRLFFLVGEQPAKSIATHIGSRIQFSLTDYGVYGLGDGSLYPQNAAGFTFDGADNDLWEGGLMIGDSYSDVSSGVHSFIMEPNMDFQVAPSGGVQLLIPGPDAPQQTWAMIDDRNAKRPLGVLVTQESYLYGSPNDDFLILRYTIKNTSEAGLTDLHVGLFMDWDIYNYAANAGGYETNGEFVWQAYNAGTVASPVLSRFRGLKLLQGALSAAGAIDSGVYRHAPRTLLPPGDGYTTDEKYGSLTCGTLYADTNKTARTDLFSIIGAGPITLTSGQLDTVTFAILAGGTLDDLRNAALRAESVVTDVDDPGDLAVLPERFTLYQNYPNPFNPVTNIIFDLPVRSHYKLEVLNVLGQTLHRTEAEARAGRVEIPWNGVDFASGTYFYRLTVGDQSLTRKMMLLK